jgi:hypothetical protein
MNKRDLEALQWTQTQKPFKNSHQGVVKYNKLIPKLGTKGKTKQKGKPLGETSKEDILSNLDIP